jgi:hypothetical protein
LETLRTSTDRQRATAAALRIFTDVFDDPTTSLDERIEARGG